MEELNRPCGRTIPLLTIVFLSRRRLPTAIPGGIGATHKHWNRFQNVDGEVVRVRGTTTTRRADFYFLLSNQAGPRFKIPRLGHKTLRSTNRRFRGPDPYPPICRPRTIRGRNDYGLIFYAISRSIGHGVKERKEGRVISIYLIYPPLSLIFSVFSFTVVSQTSDYEGFDFCFFFSPRRKRCTTDWHGLVPKDGRGGNTDSTRKYT